MTQLEHERQKESDLLKENLKTMHIQTHGRPFFTKSAAVTFSGIDGELYPRVIEISGDDIDPVTLQEVLRSHRILKELVWKYRVTLAELDSEEQ